MPRKKVTPEMVEKMRRLRKEGLSYVKIAGRLGLAPMTVYNYLEKKEKVGYLKRLRFIIKRSRK